MTRRDFYLMRICELLETTELRRKERVTVVTQTRALRSNRCDCNAITIQSTPFPLTRRYES
jgi:hypothetical protein